MACSGGDATSAPAKNPGDDGGDATSTLAANPGDHAEDLNGTYTFTVTEKAIRAAGGTDQNEIDENTGQMTVTLRDGIWKMKQIYSQGPKAGTVWRGTASYEFDGSHFKVFYSGDPGDWTTADVDIRASDGSLIFSNIHDGNGPEEQALSEAWFTTWSRTDR
jgi:hypothetical protein